MELPETHEDLYKEEFQVRFYNKSLQQRFTQIYTLEVSFRMGYQEILTKDR